MATPAPVALQKPPTMVNNNVFQGWFTQSNQEKYQERYTVSALKEEKPIQGRVESFLGQSAGVFRFFKTLDTFTTWVNTIVSETGYSSLPFLTNAGKDAKKVWQLLAVPLCLKAITDALKPVETQVEDPAKPNVVSMLSRTQLFWSGVDKCQRIIKGIGTFSFMVGIFAGWGEDTKTSTYLTNVGKVLMFAGDFIKLGTSLYGYWKTRQLAQAMSKEEHSTIGDIVILKYGPEDVNKRWSFTRQSYKCSFIEAAGSVLGGLSECGGVPLGPIAKTTLSFFTSALAGGVSLWDQGRKPINVLFGAYTIPQTTA